MIRLALLLLSYALAPFVATPDECQACKLRGVSAAVHYRSEVECPRGVVCGAGNYDDSGRFVPAQECGGCWQAGRCERGHAVIAEVR